MQLPSYEQTLKGIFVANVIPRNQCGFHVGQTRFGYTVSIEVADLDDEGFALDNMALDKALSEAYCGKGKHYRASCEDLAGGLLCVVYNLISDRAERISVSVSPNEFSELTVHWRVGDVLPKWIPVEAEPLQGSQASPIPTAIIIEEKVHA